MIKCYEELLLLFKLLCKKLIFISASTMCGWSHSAHCKVLNPILPSAFLIAALDFFFCFCLLTFIKHFPRVRYHSAKGRVCSKAELPTSATVQHRPPWRV